MNYLRDLLYNSGSVRERKSSTAEATGASSSIADRKSDAEVETKQQKKKSTPRGDLLALLEANKEQYPTDAENRHDPDEAVGLSGFADGTDVLKIEDVNMAGQGDVRSPGARRMLNNIAAYAPRLPQDAGLVPPRTPSPRIDQWPVCYSEEDSEPPKYEQSTQSPKPHKTKDESPVLRGAITMLSEQLSPPGNKITDRWQLMSEYRSLDSRLMRLEVMEAVMRIQIRAMAPSGTGIIYEDDDSAWEDVEDDRVEKYELACRSEYRDDGASIEIVDGGDEGSNSGTDQLDASYEESTKSSTDESLTMMSTLLPLGIEPVNSVICGSECMQQEDKSEEKRDVSEHLQSDWPYLAEMDQSAEFLRSNLKPGFCDPFDDEDNRSNITDDKKLLPPRRFDYTTRSRPTTDRKVNRLDEFGGRSNQENRRARNDRRGSASRREQHRPRSALSIDPFQFLRDDFDYMNDSLPTSDSDSECGQLKSITNHSSERLDDCQNTISPELNAKVTRDIMKMLNGKVDEGVLKSPQDGRIDSSPPGRHDTVQWTDLRSHSSPTCSYRAGSISSTLSTPRKSACKSPKSVGRRKGLHVRFNEFAEVRVIRDIDEPEQS
ncbi:hypothetical protein V1517DRAFT_269194 [Lipomyces orientalis]|uniref:Uncharacterized protein n=1 Tax=Lipomyces orientalis TaxID=1233043 RepID=A0ACC3TX27_9ASCO